MNFVVVNFQFFGTIYFCRAEFSKKMPSVPCGGLFSFMSVLHSVMRNQENLLLGFPAIVSQNRDDSGANPVCFQWFAQAGWGPCAVPGSH